MTRFLSLVLISALFTACSKDQQPKRQQEGLLDRVSGLFESTATPATTLKVIDTYGKVVAGAQILIGLAQNQPFAENFIATGADGSFQAPAGWTTAEPVTISAPGYVRATYMAQLPNGQTYTLRPAAAPKNLTLAGQTSGYNIVDRDGIVDFGVVIPALTKQTLFNFDISSFISPQTDTITVIGNTIEVPKNISLPKQKESYFLPIELNKPDYSLSFRTPGEKMIFVARGQFPLEDVINEVRSGKEFYELTHLFNLKGGALRQIDIQQDMALNIPVNELNFTATRQVKAPAYAADEVVLSAALAFWKGWYYPTDVKMLEASKTRNLSTAVGGTPHLVSILKRKDEMTMSGNMDRLSANLVTFDNGVVPTFLPLMEKPSIKGAFNFQVKMITRPATIFEGAQFSILSKVSTLTVGGKNIDVLENLWEVYSPTWLADTAVPQWPGEQAPTGRLRWEVTLTGLPSQNAVQNVELGPKWLDAASHATRSSQDF